MNSILTCKRTLMKVDLEKREAYYLLTSIRCDYYVSIKAFEETPFPSCEPTAAAPPNGAGRHVGQAVTRSGTIY